MKKIRARIQLAFLNWRSFFIMVKYNYIEFSILYKFPFFTHNCVFIYSYDENISLRKERKKLYGFSLGVSLKILLFRFLAAFSLLVLMLWCHLSLCVLAFACCCLLLGLELAVSLEPLLMELLEALVTLAELYFQH